MAVDQSALLELLSALKDTEVGDRVRVATERLYQELIDAEATSVIGAGMFERTSQRTSQRTAQRNGTRSRVLSTTAGDLDCGSPSCAPGRSSPACWSGVGGSTRRCSRW